MAGDEGHGFFGGADGGARRAAGEVPAAEVFEVAEEGGVVEAPAGGAGLAQQVEVVADEPDDARGDEAVEEVGALGVVVAGAEGLADVVEEGRRVHRGVGGLSPRVLEDLQGVVEGVAFGVVAGVLRDAVEGDDELEEVSVHDDGAEPEGGPRQGCAVTPTGSPPAGIASRDR